MTSIDLALGFMAGILSCLTPEALMLIPLLLCAIGARERPLSLAIGLGCSLVLAGALAASLGKVLGFEAEFLRWVFCALLILEAIILLNGRMSDRFWVFTGGSGGVFGEDAGSAGGLVFRRFLLAVFVGGIWMPRVGPVLAKSALMASDARSLPLALGTLFTFGLGAALPWIFLGRVIRWLPGVAGGGLTRGMAGKRVLALSLLALAVISLTGLDATLARDLGALLPAWVTKLSVSF